MRRAGTIGIVLAFLMCWAAPAAQAQPDSRNVLVYRPTTKTSQLSLSEKEVRLLELSAKIRTVDSFDPAVVRITTVENFQQVRLVALAPGFTSITLVDEHGQSYTVDVLIKDDVRQFQALVREAAPGSSVQAIKVKDAVLLLGWVDEAGQATKIVELAEMHFAKVLNYLQVSGVQTVMLRVRMMEAQRDKIRALGFNFLQLRQHNYVGSLAGQLVPFSNQSPSTNLANPFGGFVGPVSSAVVPTAATAVFGTVSNDNAFQGFIEALKQENLLTILAEPNLTTTNGRPANFLDGGQFPVPIPQGLGTVSIQYKSFGVQLEFVPTILSSGRLRMQVCPEVSEKDLSNTVTVQGITVPSLTTRRVNTEVEMNFGETLIIGGLISNRVQATTSKIPFLGELPWIGAAFRRVAHTESETELIVLVTPELASPTDESQLPDGPGRSTTPPTDRELYWNGYVETPRYARDPEPPPTNFGLGGEDCPPNMMGAPNGMPPNGLPPGMYDGSAARKPNPKAEPVQAGPSVPAKTTPASSKASAGDAGPALKDQSRKDLRAPQTTARQKARSTAQPGTGKVSQAGHTAGRTNKPARPSKPAPIINSTGPIAPASGIRPANDRQAVNAGYEDRPGLIAP
ncbi:MAG: pilus assembly protein N-terminal domain-containing protein [Planctomycetia bacterium]|nr:pilus assembly protein N-terminal domain-containing protein [Planctomycetia bacterium]